METSIVKYTNRLAYIFDDETLSAWEESFPGIGVYHKCKSKHPKTKIPGYDWRDVVKFYLYGDEKPRDHNVYDLNADDATTLKIGVIKSYQILTEKQCVKDKAIPDEYGEFVSHHDLVDALYGITHQKASMMPPRTFAFIMVLVLIAAILLISWLGDL